MKRDGHFCKKKQKRTTGQATRQKRFVWGLVFSFIPVHIEKRERDTERKRNVVGLRRTNCLTTDELCVFIFVFDQLVLRLDLFCFDFWHWFLGTLGLDKSRQFAQDEAFGVGDAAFDLSVAGVDDERQGAPTAPRVAVQRVLDGRTEHERAGHLGSRRQFAVDALVPDGLDVDLESLHAEISAGETDDLAGSRLSPHGDHFHSDSTCLTRAVGVALSRRGRKRRHTRW